MRGMTSTQHRGPRQAEAERNDHALLEAARTILVRDGIHASVAAIAARAGVGIGSLYRRFPSKELLFQRVVAVALEEWNDLAQEALQVDDAWDGFVHYFVRATAPGRGSLGPVAGLVAVTPDMVSTNTSGNAAAEALVARAQADGRLRDDVTVVDVFLLIEQLSRSPLQGELADSHDEVLAAAAEAAHLRSVTIVLDGLRSAAANHLPGDPPGEALLAARWEQASS